MRPTRSHAILLPGAVMPAALAYTDLVNALGSDVDARFKDLEVYAGDQPPPGYGLSTDYYRREAERLSGVFRDFRVEVFEERHHFDPPHRIEPDRCASLLRGFWERAEAAGS